MPLFEDQTPELIRDRVLKRMESDLQTREGSFSYDMASPLSVELWRVLMTMGELVSAFYVDETSGPYLDKHARLLGMERRSGTKAACVVHFSGRDGVVIPGGTSFFTESGEEYRLTGDVTLENGGGTGSLEAVEVGDTYNTETGEITQILRNIGGLDGFTTEAATGGTDPEGDAALFGRIDFQRKNPATSGNENHYLGWALSCDGIGGVKTVGRWNGPGTVLVLVAGYDYEPVDETVVNTCAAYIQTKRPVGADVTVQSVSRMELNVEATVILDDTAKPDTVRAAFLTALDEYLKQAAAAYFREDEIYDYVLYYKRIAALLICVEGVVDYTALAINGGTENLLVPGTAVPACGEVRLT